MVFSQEKERINASGREGGERVIFLKNLITAFLSTVVMSVLFALYQYYPVQEKPDVLEFSFEGYLVYDFLYIGTVYLFVIVPLSLWVNAKFSSYWSRLALFSLAGIVIGLSISFYIHSELPVADPEGIYLVYGLASLAAAVVYFHIYLLLSALFNRKRAGG